jgi:hypothetical protein
MVEVTIGRAAMGGSLSSLCQIGRRKSTASGSARRGTGGSKGREAGSRAARNSRQIISGTRSARLKPAGVRVDERRR